MKKNKIFLLFLGIFCLSLVSASFQVGNLSHDITESYGLNQYLKGWVNLSFSNEPIDSLFETSLGDNIRLLELLLLDSSITSSYSCLPIGCETSYSESNAETSKTFEMSAEGNVLLLGLKFSGGMIGDINDFEMNVNPLGPVNSQSSQDPQVTFDFFNDGIIDWIPYKSSGSFQASRFGCFEHDQTLEMGWIDTPPYCQKINLKPAPTVKIGAALYDNTGTGESVEMKLTISNDFGTYGTCYTNASGTNNISCIPDVSLPQETDYDVCINLVNTEDRNKYKIRFEQNNPCGFAGEVPYDFEILAKPGNYGILNSFTLNNTEFENAGGDGDIEGDIWGDLNSRYYLDCSNDCIVPIKITTTNAVEFLELNSLNINYIAGGISRSNNNFYDITESVAGINSDFILINLDKGEFPTTSDTSSVNFGNQTFSLALNEEEIFSQDIIIQHYPEVSYLRPLIVTISNPTEFQTGVDIYDSVSILRYDWDFGDGTTKTSLTNNITHTYNQTGVYNVKISILDSMQRNSSKSFDISVTTPQKAVNETLTKKSTNLERVQSQLAEFTLFQRTIINSMLNLTQSQEIINKVTNDFFFATNETPLEEYTLMLTSLNSINIPEQIISTSHGEDLPFYTKKEKINLDVLGEIGGTSDYTSEEYKDPILLWDSQNINTKVTFEEFTITYEGVQSNLITTFIFDVEEINSTWDSYYLVLEGLEDLKFEKDYSEIKSSDYTYVDLSQTAGLISFSTTSEVQFVDLPIFISPDVNSLYLTEKKTFSWFTAEKTKWFLYGLALLILILIGIFVYIALQKWYKNKYEKHLFPNKNDLYNLINYVQNSKRRGLTNEDIERNLKQSKWTGEQVKYVLKKYAGKNTGLPEIPINKLFKKQKSAHPQRHDSNSLRFHRFNKRMGR